MSGPSEASRASRSRSTSPIGAEVARDDLDPAGRAPGVAAAAVQDVDPGILDRQDELLARLDLERLLAFDRHGWHARSILVSYEFSSHPGPQAYGRLVEVTSRPRGSARP